MSLFALAVSACLALILTVLPVHAAGPTLQVDPMDQPLTISRMLTNSTTTLGGDIRLTAIGGDISNLRLLASDLHMMNDVCPSTPSPQSTSTPQSASTMIDRSNISIPAGTSLKDMQPTDVLVTITHVTHPGTYCGFLDFYDGLTGSKLLTVPLILSVSASPNVTSLDDTITVQVVNNQWPQVVDESLVNIVLSNSYEQDTWRVRLLNQTLSPVNILSMTLDLKGEKTGVDFSPDPNETFPCVTFPLLLPANQIKPISFMIKRDMLPPDHYHGMIRLILENSDTAVNVPVDVNLRNGPFWPIMLLILGILLGRLAVNLYSPIAIKRNELRERARDVPFELLPVNNEEAQSDVVTKLKKIEGQIYSTNNDEKLTALGNSFDRLEQRIQFYIQLEDVEKIINEKVQDIDQEQARLWLRDVNGVRRSMRNIDVDGAIDDPQKKLDGLRDALKKWIAQLETKAINQPEIEALSISLEEKLTAAQKSLGGMGEQKPTVEQPSPNMLKRLWDNFKQLMKKIWYALWGTQAERARRRDMWLRPLMKWILVIFLALIGLQTLYLSNATFGASGLFEYLPLLLWGFGSNVAGSTFQNLPLPSSRG